MSYENIEFDVTDGIATIALNRPEARNALVMAMRPELEDAVNRVRVDDDVRAVILTGNGGAFCAGGDVKSMGTRAGGGFSTKQRIDNAHAWLYQLVDLQKPVIAAVDGPAFGAGCNLALTADFILATPRAKFCEVFGRIGLVPDFAGFFLLPRIVGLQKAKEMMFSARVVGAEEAKDLGIVYRIVPQDELMAEARALAGRFLHASTAAIGLAKRALNRSFQSDYHTLSEFEGFGQATLFTSDYHKEAVRRFGAKEQLEFVWEEMDRKEAAE
jgi:2-(1,2-epoxy-1,2-dihydrophenyl)acetyl-CoA isomerase